VEKLPARDDCAQIYYMHDAVTVVRKYSGLTHEALIERFERSLVEKGLLRFPGSSPGEAQVDQKLYRFTDFGVAFCEFLKAGD
jgi:hypothetical protein